MKHSMNSLKRIKAHLTKAQIERKIDEIRRRLIQFEMTLEDLEGVTLMNVSEELEDLRDECVHEARNEIKIYKTLIEFVGDSDPRTTHSSAPPPPPTNPYIQWTPMKFNGDRAQFPAFWESFTESIDRTTLSKAIKVKCLTDCLEGQAKELAEGVAKTGENYSEIKAIIQNKYRDVQKLLTTYFSTPIVTGSKPVSSLMDQSPTRCYER